MGLQVPSYLISQIPTSTCLISLPNLTFNQGKCPKAANHRFRTARQHRTQQANSASSHTAHIGANMDCLHSYVTYSNNKLKLSEVLFCSSMLNFFLGCCIIFQHYRKNSFLYLGITSLLRSNHCYFIVFLSSCTGFSCFLFLKKE